MLKTFHTLCAAWFITLLTSFNLPAQNEGQTETTPKTNTSEPPSSVEDSADGKANENILSDKSKQVTIDISKLPIPVTLERLQASQDNKKKVFDSFSNLPAEKRQEYRETITKARNLLNEKRLAEGIKYCYKAKGIFPEDPQTSNMLAVAYINIRDFKGALAIYAESLALDPLNSNINYNIGEIYFVSKQFKKSLLYLRQAQALSYNLSSKLTPIIEYKIALSMLSLSKDKSIDAEERKTYKKQYDEIFKSSQENELTYIYYIMQATELFESGKSIEGLNKVNLAFQVFQNEAQSAAWLDTLSEYGYMTDPKYAEKDEE